MESSQGLSLSLLNYLNLQSVYDVSQSVIPKGVCEIINYEIQDAFKLKHYLYREMGTFCTNKTNVLCPLLIYLSSSLGQWKQI